MPIYIYRNITTGETHEVVQSMNDVHEYSGADGSETNLWRRVFTKPLASFDTTIRDPHSIKEFRKVTNKNMKVGELMDLSAELSEKREHSAGKDPVKEQFAADYKKRTGKDNINLKPKTYENDKVKVEYD